MAQLNAHYSNSQWLADTGEGLEEFTVDRLALTLDVIGTGRRFTMDPEKVLRIKHLGEIAGYLQDEETATGMGKIRSVVVSVSEIYEMAFPHGGGEAGQEAAGAGKEVQ